MCNMRRNIVLLVAIISLGAINYEIWKKEKILADSEQVFINLRPVDPRSIMQGDYMILRYRMPREILSKRYTLPRKGYLLGEIDAKRILTIKSIYTDGMKLSAQQRKILYRLRKSNVQVGSGAYFFQEGHGKYYEGNKAQYGEIRLSKSGDSVLVALRDKDLKLLGPNKDRAHQTK